MSTHPLHVLVVALVGLCAPAGCAQDLARASSSAIGCPHDAIEISAVSVGWSQMSWTARCNGMDFYCSGEADAACAPEAFLPPESEAQPASPGPVPASAPTQPPAQPPPSDPPAPTLAPPSAASPPATTLTPPSASSPAPTPTPAPTTDAVKPLDEPATTSD